MIAPPPGQGVLDRQQWIQTLLVYGLGTLIGAATIGVLIFVLGRLVRPSILLITTVAALSLLWLAIGVKLRRRTWQVPRRLSFLGIRKFGLVFGWFLGIAVVTEAPAISLYPMLAWPAVAPSLIQALVVMLAFGFARWLPTVLIGIETLATQNRTGLVLSRLRGRFERSTPLEIALLGNLIVVSLLVR